MEYFRGWAADIRLATRSLVRHPAWSVLVIATLTLGIGANSTLFTVINAVLLRPLPYPHSERVVSLSERAGGTDRQVVSSPLLAGWQQSATSFEAMAAYRSTSATIGDHADPEIVSGLSVSAGYFTALGVTPVRGRPPAAEENLPGAAAVVVISDQLWRRQFGADTGLLGHIVRLDGNPRTVIGIMPPDFSGPGRPQYWVPLRTVAPQGVVWYYSAIGRLRSGANIESARAELDRINRVGEADLPVALRGSVPVVMSLHDRLYGGARRSLLMLMAAVGVLLLIACANVANLMLARAVRQRRELALRVALGASRGRLMRFLFCESMVLSLAGAVLGLLLAQLLAGALVQLSHTAVASVGRVEVDLYVIGFTLLLTVVTAILFGVLPALFAGGSDLGAALVRGGSSSTASTGQRRVRRGLVVAELATSLVMLTSALVLTRSFVHVASIDSGMQPERLETARFQLSAGYRDGTRASEFYGQVITRLRTYPAVESVAIADAAPLSGVNMTMTSTDSTTGRPLPAFDLVVASNDYFRTIGIGALRGRTFTADDKPGAGMVAVINATMARTMFGDLDPVGRSIAIDGTSRGTATIIGVIADVRQRGVEHRVTPTAYISTAQQGTSAFMTLLVRTRDGVAAGALTALLRHAAREVDSLQVVPPVVPLTKITADAAAPRRFSFMLVGLLAALAVSLAAVGLYGIVMFQVAERTREIGIRVAIGADPERVAAMVVREGMGLTLIGIVSGLAGSAAAVRALRSVVFEVDVLDPVLFLGGALLLAAVGLVACWAPARRATRVDPMVALRAE